MDKKLILEPNTKNRFRQLDELFKGKTESEVSLLLTAYQFYRVNGIPTGQEIKNDILPYASYILFQLP